MERNKGVSEETRLEQFKILAKEVYRLAGFGDSRPKSLVGKENIFFLIDWVE
jgi:hypothetical protein